MLLMAHDHEHEGHSHGGSADADRGELAIALGLIIAFMAVEVTDSQSMESSLSRRESVAAGG
jgi:hypothetical protein